MSLIEYPTESLPTVRRARGTRVVRVLGLAGAAFFALVVVAAIFAPFVAPHDPEAQDLARRFAPPGTGERLLGGDQLGRDVLSRLIYGARVSLAVSFAAVSISAVFGTAMGLLAGYSAGLRARFGILERLVLVLSEMALAIPGIILAVAVAALFGTSMRNLIIILALFGWVVFARLTHGIVLSLHSRAFVEAAGVLGAGHLRIVFRHMLPYVLPQVVVVAALQIGFMILVESALSYLGLGVQPPTPTWGNMIAEGREALGESPWMAVFAGLAITLTVLSINFAADLVRERIAGTATIHV
jgi:peptide/nickel transport system permease protein